MLRNERFQIIPVSILRADLLTPSTDWEKTSQGFYLGECFLQLAECGLKLPLGILLLRHIQGMAHDVGWIAIFSYHQVPI
jgi:hypothetical protein